MSARVVSELVGFVQHSSVEEVAGVRGDPDR
jgi:hypothetical protein